MWQTLLYQFLLKSWLNARLKSDIDDLYIDKLKTAHIDLGILCNVVKKFMLLKRLYMMNWLLLLEKVNAV